MFVPLLVVEKWQILQLWLRWAEWLFAFGVPLPYAGGVLWQSVQDKGVEPQSFVVLAGTVPVATDEPLLWQYMLEQLLYPLPGAGLPL